MTEFGPVAPSVLNRGIAERIGDHLTTGQFDRLANNLGQAGVTEFLGDAAPWTGFADTMSGITDVETKLTSEASPKSPLHLTQVRVTFEGPTERERFDHLNDLALAGVGDLSLPYTRVDGQNRLILHNYSYAEIRTLGRVGTALLRRQFIEEMGPNILGVTQKTIGDIEASDITDYMPEELLRRMAAQKETFGDAASGTLLSSGNLSHIGMSMREVLAGRTLEVQRPRSNRPLIEAGTDFISNGNAMPVSRTTIAHTLKVQGANYGQELIKPVKERDLLGVASRLWDLATGLGIKEGVIPAVRATGTLTMATSAALQEAMVDRVMRRHARS
jgi:hypothetical protein